jgi:hypothetical protein
VALSSSMIFPAVFITLGIAGIYGNSFPIFRSFWLGIAGAILAAILYTFTIAGGPRSLITARGATFFAKVKDWLTTMGIMALCAAAIGYFLACAAGGPVAWWATTPYKTVAQFESGKVGRGDWIFDTYSLHFTGELGAYLDLDWPRAIRDDVGKDKPLHKGTQATLEGRTSWAGTVIDRIAVKDKDRTVTFHRDGRRTP